MDRGKAKWVKKEIWLLVISLLLLALASTMFALGGSFRGVLFDFLKVRWRLLVSLGAVAIVEVFFLARLLRFVSARLEALGLGQDICLLATGLVRWGLLLVGLLILLDLLQFRGTVQALVGTAGIVSLAIGLASRDIAANIVSGLFLILDSDIRLGDEIKVGTVRGRIVALRLRHTVMQEQDGTIVIVPNTTMTSQYIWNYSLAKGRLQGRKPPEGNEVDG